MSAPTAELYAPTAEAISASGVVAPAAVARYALGLGDDALILSHRVAEWIAWAPEVEEDIALANIALDLLGHARSLLTYAGSADGRTEDDLAYFRDEAAFRSRHLFEQPRGDFAFTVARQLIASVYFDETYRRLAGSADPVLAAIAVKALKETRYHLDHAIQWTRRLGLGTRESNAKMQAALRELWPSVDELFAPDDAVAGLDGVAVDPVELREPVLERVAAVLEEAELPVPGDIPAQRGGGRSGVHSEHLGHLLATMQSLARQHPGATW
jgi:ring-1,2-phenylacetyl-CoA epoxidase subunit PaaC